MDELLLFNSIVSAPHQPFSDIGPIGSRTVSSQHVLIVP